MSEGSRAVARNLLENMPRAEAVHAHVGEILASPTFVNSPTLSRLLRYLVEKTLEGRTEDLKEYCVGVEVFCRGPQFDPRTDTIVRVEARRLRQKLEEYYTGLDRDSPLVIKVPKGRYVVAFKYAYSHFQDVAADSEGLPTPPAKDARRCSVGRKGELAELDGAFQSAARGNGLVLCVAGESGIGKSTLVETFSSQLRQQEADCYFGKGRCSERLAGSEAYLPLLEALEGMLRSGGPAARLLQQLAPTWYFQLVPLSVEESSKAQGQADVKAASQERLKRELVAYLEALSRLHPLVLFFDDMQWADASTVDVLAYAASRIATMPVLFIAAYRPADLLMVKHPFLQVRQELQAHGVCRELKLNFLRHEDIEEYLAIQFGESSFPHELVQSIHATTEGNALFMVDLVDHLKARKVMAQVDGRWALAQSWPEMQREMPESSRSLIQRKIDRLDEPARRLASAAAVQGHEFDSATIAMAVGVDPAEVEDGFDALDRLHSLVTVIGPGEFPDGTATQRYVFVHVLYQNVLESSLAPSRRASLSGAIATALTEHYGKASDAIASQLALLLETARDFARAADYFLAAARNAAHVYAYPEARLRYASARPPQRRN